MKSKLLLVLLIPFMAGCALVQPIGENIIDERRGESSSSSSSYNPFDRSSSEDSYDPFGPTSEWDPPSPSPSSSSSSASGTSRPASSNKDDYSFSDPETIYLDSDPYIGVYVSAYLGSDRTILLPEESYSYNCYGVDEDAFYEKSNLDAVYFPNRYAFIEQYAFYKCSLKYVDLNPIRYIGQRAFCRSGLESVTIPSTVITMGDFVFSNCSSLAQLTFANRESANLTLPFSCFSGCSELTSVYLSGVYDVQEYAFASCTNLTAVYIPYGVQYIDQLAFSSCSNIDFYIEREESERPSGWDINFSNYGTAHWGSPMY